MKLINDDFHIGWPLLFTYFVDTVISAHLFTERIIIKAALPSCAIRGVVCDV